jgi:hypothetical protein
LHLVENEQRRMKEDECEPVSKTTTDTIVCPNVMRLSPTTSMHVVGRNSHRGGGGRLFRVELPDVASRLDHHGMITTVHCITNQQCFLAQRSHRQTSLLR